jgi:hypothetical protein
METPVRSADCSRCAALCCVSLAFSRSTRFAFDKPAGVACPHLTPADRCRIHDRLEGEGFAGCARYDCGGAGQRVVGEMFQGRSWRADPERARAMFDAFLALRDIHELHALLLTAARRLPLSVAQGRTCHRLLRTLEPAGGWSTKRLARFQSSGLPARIHAFIGRLREHVSPKARRRLPVVPSC